MNCLNSFILKFFIFNFVSYAICCLGFIQIVSRLNVNVLGGHSIGQSKQKVYMYMCLISNGFRDRAISLYSTLYTVQTSNTPCPHTSCTVH
jgi:hypothetical protein